MAICWRAIALYLDINPEHEVDCARRGYTMPTVSVKIDDTLVNAIIKNKPNATSLDFPPTLRSKAINRLEILDLMKAVSDTPARTIHAISAN